MNNVDRQAQMMDYLYGEMTDQDRREYELWLDQNPSVRQEIEEMQTSRQWLADVETVQPSPLLVELKPQTGISRAWLYRAGAAAAVLLALWMFNFQIRTDQGGVILSFGNPVLQQPQPVEETDAIPAAVWEKFLAEHQQKLEQQLLSMDSSWQNRMVAMQKENKHQWQLITNNQAHQVAQVKKEFTEQELPRLAGLMQQLQIEQQEELQLLLVEFWNTWQETRQTDLEHIDFQMTNLYEDVERNQQASEARVVNYIQNVAGR
ncbi:anti-sigma factor family protein [Flavilitoribacter nigricans]|uniref:Anti-sigma factor n=1 Tax=Flavilitoribacter nigricans (strain ATCC 23147 / DSM 23189 / NBRC 102662 / NCIMB 1420 / SS-2) TaxID=1122177 RepID=A0A2D0N937_FLAN2|nr:hypothetical protein [Flavilitoribacter nigricans]PHN04293.1 hypothetical protein CRP01_22280 [Flavilitoribacter nigricans DSM 23189 = NBRC 102662]